MNAKILAEIDFVFSQLPPSYRKKIPTDMIEYAHNNKDMDHFNTFDNSKPFTKQDLDPQTIEVLHKLINNIEKNEK